MKVPVLLLLSLLPAQSCEIKSTLFRSADKFFSVIFSCNKTELLPWQLERLRHLYGGVPQIIWNGRAVGEDTGFQLSLVVDPGSVENLTLTEFKVNSLSSRNLDVLKEFTSLKKLHFISNRFHTASNDLFYLKSFLGLSFVNNSLKSLEHKIDDESSVLTSLIIDEPDLELLGSFRFPCLEELTLKCRLLDFEGFKDLPALKSLTAKDTWFPRNELIISRPENLEKLSVTNCSLERVILADLKSLRVANFSFNKLRDFDLKQLSGSSSMELLVLDSNLIQALDDMETLNFSISLSGNLLRCKWLNVVLKQRYTKHLKDNGFVCETVYWEPFFENIFVMEVLLLPLTVFSFVFFLLKKCFCHRLESETPNTLQLRQLPSLQYEDPLSVKAYESPPLSPTCPTIIYEEIPLKKVETSDFTASQHERFLDQLFYEIHESAKAHESDQPADLADLVNT